MAAAVLLCGDHKVILKQDILEIVGPTRPRTCQPSDATCTLEGSTLVLKLPSGPVQLNVDSVEEAKAWVSLFSKQAAASMPRMDRAHTIIVKKKNKRQYLTLEDSVIKVYMNVDSNGNPPKDSAKKITLSSIRAIKIFGNTMLIEAFKTWELTVESPQEAQAWAQLVECAMEEWTLRELEDVQRRISTQSAMDDILSGEGGGGGVQDAFAPPPLPRQLDKDLLETLAVSRALKLTSVMHAGFMLKLGGLRKNVWERRYFVLHISGVLNYYEQPWDPAKQMEPSGILILPQLLAVEWGEVVTGCTCWPADTTNEQRLKLVFDRKTYFLCCHTEDDCERWKDAVMDVANLFEDDEDAEGGPGGSEVDGFEFISPDTSMASVSLTPAATLARATSKAALAAGMASGSASGSSSPNTLRRAQGVKQRRSLFLHTEFQGESVVDDHAHEYALASDRTAEYALASDTPSLAAAPPMPTTTSSSAASTTTAKAAAAASASVTTATASTSASTSTSASSSSAPTPTVSAQGSKLRLGKMSQAFIGTRPPTATAAAAAANTSTREEASAGRSEQVSSTSTPTLTPTPTPIPTVPTQAPAPLAAAAGPAGNEEKLTTEQKAERERLQSEMPSGGAVARAKLEFAAATGNKNGAPSRRPQVSLVEPERDVPSARPPPSAAAAAATGPSLTTKETASSGGASGAAAAGGRGLGVPALGGAHARASRRAPIERSPTKQSPSRAPGGKSVRRQPAKPDLPSKVTSEAQLKPLETQLNAITIKPMTARSAAFIEFLEAPDLPELRSAFETVLISCGLTPDTPNLYERLKTVLTPSLNFKQKSLFQVIDKRRRALLTTNESCADLDVIVSGGGPIGLRTAIEMVLLEAQVTIVERREKFSRFNILHLWDWVYTDLVSLGANGADLLGKSYFHIGTRDLQLLLARIAILAGVKFMVGYETADVSEPDEASEGLWRVSVRKLSDQSVIVLPANVLFVAGGANDGVAARLGFEPIVLGTSSAVGLVAHFANTGTPIERNLEELSYARQYFPDLFGSLDSKGLCLENIVYYQGNTHYYVMTPKRDALLAYGVIKTDLPAPQDLARDNIDQEKLRSFARAAAEFFRLPPACPFVTEGAPVQLFDFSTRKASKTSCKIRSDAQGNQMAVMLVGDAVLEPFWPEGLGINRGFHTAFDAIWVIQKFFATGHVEKPPAMQSAREELFTIIKSLSAFTKGNIVVENTKGYSLNPGSRYKAWRG